MTNELKKALQDVRDLQAGTTFVITCRCVECGRVFTGDPIMAGWEHLQCIGPENDPAHQLDGWYCLNCYMREWEPDRWKRWHEERRRPYDEDNSLDDVPF